MTTSRFHNALRGIAAAAGQGRANSRLGLVSAYDPNRYAVKVKFPPDDVETGWIPLVAMQVGNGFGIYAAPNLDDEIMVHAQDGAGDAYVAAGCLFTDEDVPLPVPAGEIWLVHASGASWKLTNDGKATFSDGHGASIALNGDGTISSAGNWSHTGNMAFIGQVSANGHRIDETHKHLNSGGSGLGGVVQ